MKNRPRIIFRIVLCLLLFDSFASTGEAVYEGTANSNMMIRRYERKGQFGRVALWREVAAKCLDTISIPLAEITIEYCRRTGEAKIVRKMEAEIADAKVQREEHLKLARVNWEKAEEDEGQLDAERIKLDKFMAEWVPHYPDRFYEFGIYRNIFKERTDKLKERGQFSDALLVEADASDMCARQYNDVTIRYFQNRMKDAEKTGDTDMAQKQRLQMVAYQEVRDKHLGRSTMLRALARQNPTDWPAAASKIEFKVPESKRTLTHDKAIKSARGHKTIKQILKEHKNAREFAWFQGFAWTVSYYSRGWENLAIVFVDDETGKVTDVLLSPGDLEAKKNEELVLSPEEVIKIAKEYPKVKDYFKNRPGARANAAYNWRYNCWMVELIVGDREVGFVTISDETKEVLEISLNQEKN